MNILNSCTFENYRIFQVQYFYIYEKATISSMYFRTLLLQYILVILSFNNIKNKNLKMDDSDISRILKSQIGSTLCKGFAALYRTKPQFPVSYLANWLLQQAKNTSVLNNLKNQEEIKQIKSQELQNINKNKAQILANKKIQPVLNQKLEVLKQIIEKYEFKEDLLSQILPQFIKQKQEVSNCYIAELQYPFKKVQETDQYVQDLQAQKILKYIGASKNNHKLMIGQVLQPQQGISWQVFKQEDEFMEDAQISSQEPQKKDKLKQIYIPNVLKENRIHYFRLPKLGSYLAYQWIVDSYLVEQAFDKGGAKEKQYNQMIEEMKKEHEDKVSEMKAELEQKQTKQNYQDDEAYINLKLQYQILQTTPLVLPILQFPSVQRVFLVGCDTLGNDCEISKQKQDNIQHILKYFKRNWEESQKKSLIHDLQMFANYSNTIQQDSEKLQEQIETEGSAHVQRVSQKALGQKDLKYEVQVAKFAFLKKNFLQKGKQYLKIYGSYNIPKFQGLLKDLLIFFKYDISNYEDSNKQLNWRKARSEIPELFNKILDKVQIINNKISLEEEEQLNKLLSKLQKYDFETIGSYNMGLWMLVQLIKRFIQLTLLASQMFKQRKQSFFKERQNKIEEKERILEDRAKAFEEYVNSLEEEEKQKLNEMEWYVNYDTEHPIPIIEEIPEEFADPNQVQQQEIKQDQENRQPSEENTKLERQLRQEKQTEIAQSQSKDEQQGQKRQVDDKTQAKEEKEQQAVKIESSQQKKVQQTLSEEKQVSKD